jgi:hypothetical protein
VEYSKINLREIGLDGMDWIDLAQDRDQWRALVNSSSIVARGLLGLPRDRYPGSPLA